MLEHKGLYWSKTLKDRMDATKQLKPDEDYDSTGMGREQVKLLKKILVKVSPNRYYLICGMWSLLGKVVLLKV